MRVPQHPAKGDRMTTSLRCTCKAEHWQPHAAECPRAFENKATPGPVQTEVCPVCRTVHDRPLCPQAPGAIVKELNANLCANEGHVFARIPVKECLRCHELFAAHSTPETTRELAASEAASFDKAFARSPRRVPEKTFGERPSNYQVNALRARLANKDMRWSRAHVEGLINQLEQLTKQRDEGWGNFYKLRKQVAEERYPGMTAPVRAPDVTCSCGHHERYHFDDGKGAIVCRYADDCGCSRPVPPRGAE